MLDCLEALETPKSTQNVTVIGGPRQSAAERRLANSAALQTLGTTVKRGNAPRHIRESNREGTLGAAEDAQQAELSAHLAVMDRLRQKVQPRSKLGVKVGNAVLAAADGHRPADDDDNKRSRKRLEGSAVAAGVSISRRARAMSAKAEVDRARALAGAALTFSANNCTKNSENNRVGGTARGGGALGGGDDGKGIFRHDRPQELASRTPRKEDDSTTTANGVNGNVNQNASDVAVPERIGSTPDEDIEEGKEKERVAPRARSSSSRNNIRRSNATASQGRNSAGNVTSSVRSDNASSLLKTQGKTAPRSAWSAGRGSFGAKSSTKASFLHTSQPITGNGSILMSSGGAQRPFHGLTSRPSTSASRTLSACARRTGSALESRLSAPAPGQLGVPGRAFCDNDDMTRDGGTVGGSGSSAPDEVSLAVAIANIISGDSSLCTTSADGRATAEAYTATGIVNIVGSSSGRAAHTEHSAGGIPRAGQAASVYLNVMSSSTTSTATAAGASKHIPKATSSEAALAADDSAGEICQTCLVGPAGGRSKAKTKGGDDWRLRASRAVGRCLQQEKEQATGVTGPAHEIGGDRLTEGVEDAVPEYSTSSKPWNSEDFVSGEEHDNNRKGEACSDSARGSYSRRSRQGDDSRGRPPVSKAAAVAAGASRKRIGGSEEDGDDEWSLGTRSQRSGDPELAHDCPKPSQKPAALGARSHNIGITVEALGSTGAVTASDMTFPAVRFGNTARGERGPGSGNTEGGRGTRKRKLPKKTEVGN